MDQNDAPPGSPPTPTYEAFISYRRSDGARGARWLRRRLQSYRLPRALRANRPKRLRVYLDQAYERGVADFYQDNILPALKASKYLIVVASPDAASREADEIDWMRREAEDFDQTPQRRNVLVARAAGAFEDPLPPATAARHPNVEVVDLRGLSLARFLPGRWTRLRNEVFKVAAALYGVDGHEMPVLRREEERHQRRKLSIGLGIIVGVLLGAIALSVYAFRESARADRTLDDALALSNRMVSNLAMDSFEGTADEERRFLTLRACDLLDRLRDGEVTTRIYGSFAACQLERAREHVRFDEPERAAKRYALALRVGKRLVREDPSNLHTNLELVWVVLEFGDLDAEDDRTSQAVEKYATAIELAQEMVARHDEHSGALVSLARCHLARADVAERDAAIASVRTAITTLTSASLEPSLNMLGVIAKGHGRLARLLEEEDPDASLRAWIDAVTVRRRALAQEPEYTSLQSLLAEDLEPLAEAWMDAGFTLQAAALCDEAYALHQTLRDGPSLAGWLASLDELRSRVAHKEGRHADAAKLAVRAADAGSVTDPDVILLRVTAAARWIAAGKNVAASEILAHLQAALPYYRRQLEPDIADRLDLVLPLLRACQMERSGGQAAPYLQAARRALERVKAKGGLEPDMIAGFEASLGDPNTRAAVFDLPTTSSTVGAADWAAHARQGEEALRSGRIDEAEASLRKALRMGVREAVPFAFLGAVLAKKKRVHEAQVCLSQAQELAGDTASEPVDVLVRLLGEAEAAGNEGGSNGESR